MTAADAVELATLKAALAESERTLRVVRSDLREAFAVPCSDHAHGLRGSLVDGHEGCPWCRLAESERARRDAEHEAMSCRRCMDATVDAVQAERERAIAERDAYRAALDKINVIRNSIVGTQAINWSEHIYPLVAALDAAGIEGMPYPEARAYFGSMLERTVKAEAQQESYRAALAELVGALSKCERCGEPAMIQLWRYPLHSPVPFCDLHGADNGRIKLTHAPALRAALALLAKAPA